jgi:hypothetical protein
MLTRRLPIRRLIECSFAATLFVPAILRPKLMWEAKDAGRFQADGRYAPAWRFFPLPSSAGIQGKRKEGYRVNGVKALALTADLSGT